MPARECNNPTCHATNLRPHCKATGCDWVTCRVCGADSDALGHHYDRSTP